MTNTKNLRSSNWKSIIKKFLDEASWFQGSPISVTKINTSAITGTSFVTLPCCDYVVKAKEQYVDPHEPWSTNFENWHPKLNMAKHIKYHININMTNFMGHVTPSTWWRQRTTVSSTPADNCTRPVVGQSVHGWCFAKKLCIQVSINHMMSNVYSTTLDRLDWKLSIRNEPVFEIHRPLTQKDDWFWARHQKQENTIDSDFRIPIKFPCVYCAVARLNYFPSFRL